MSSISVIINHIYEWLKPGPLSCPFRLGNEGGMGMVVPMCDKSL